ncbi:hypothetical protein C9374_008636 [Naegleria lovaniensis]|uniref:Uncharacterized protein n=1 Tax=Naegleria lovaniensis TaxID=51637 RepID=A0AA88KKN9_NAELO|nr:uncharacterized protein C9374_008636 [Naegleria lovaniensis]KAG2378014.1 hypothetical protein C9374_008636 [Naegleria lovaniensis]
MSRSVLEFQLRLFDEYVQQVEISTTTQEGMNNSTSNVDDTDHMIGGEANTHEEKQEKKNTKKQLRKKRDEKKHAKESLSDKVKKDSTKKLNIYKENVKIMKRKRKQLLANKQSQLLELLTKK